MTVTSDSFKIDESSFLATQTCTKNSNWTVISERKPPKSCLTCLISPAAGMPKEGWQCFLVPWVLSLTWVCLSHLHLVSFSAEEHSGLKHNNNIHSKLQSHNTVFCTVCFLDSQWWKKCLILSPRESRCEECKWMRASTEAQGSMRCVWPDSGPFV